MRILTPKKHAMRGNSEISGKPSPLSHFPTDCGVIPRYAASVSCVIFSFCRRARNVSFMLIFICLSPMHHILSVSLSFFMIEAELLLVKNRNVTLKLQNTTIRCIFETTGSFCRNSLQSTLRCGILALRLAITNRKDPLFLRQIQTDFKSTPTEKDKTA